MSLEQRKDHWKQPEDFAEWSFLSQAGLPCSSGEDGSLSLCMHLKPFLSGRHLEAVHAFLILKRQCNTETIEHSLFFFFFPHWRHWISRAALLPGLSMKGVKPQSSLALWVLSVLGSSYLHLMCYRGKIKTSQWRGGGARGSCFPRDLSPWISPRLLSIDLLLWQLWQKEGQTLNSHKSAFLARSGNYWEQKSGSESLRTWCPLLMLPPCCSEALDPQGAVLLLLNLQKERKCTADPLSSSAPLVLFTLADIFQDV